MNRHQQDVLEQLIILNKPTFRSELDDLLDASPQTIAMALRDLTLAGKLSREQTTSESGHLTFLYSLIRDHHIVQRTKVGDFFWQEVAWAPFFQFTADEEEATAYAELEAGHELYEILTRDISVPEELQPVSYLIEAHPKFKVGDLVRHELKIDKITEVVRRPGRESTPALVRGKLEYEKTNTRYMYRLKNGFGRNPRTMYGEMILSAVKE